MTTKIEESIIKHFQFKGEYIYCEPFGCGHINSTYAIYFRRETASPVRYILQCINTNIFTDPKGLMNNIDLVTSYLRDKILLAGGDPDRETLTIVKTTDGKPYYTDEEGRCYRAYLFIEDATCYQSVDKPGLFYKAAKAFGNFQKLLKDYPADTLVETIPNFHNTVTRYNNFIKAVEADNENRVQYVTEEIKFIKDREADCGIIVSMIADSSIPLRVTHNDTKLNNIMMDNSTDTGICVIDLDTVMPGSLLYDFGDSIRFGASSALEDETDISKVYMRLDLFEEYVKGFLEGTGGALTQKELDSLPLSAKIMTLECGIRFLTDYLEGDHYFKIHRENHNLDRARTQFKLVADMEDKMEAMSQIINKYSS